MDMHSSQKSAHQYHDFEMGNGNGFAEDEAFYDAKKTNSDDRRDMLRMNKPQEMRVRKAPTRRREISTDVSVHRETSKP